jgi:serine/threonine protein kinase
MTTELKIEKLGRYRIEEILGQGAMAIVYKAVDPRIDRTVAIKALNIHSGLSEEQAKQFRERFIHEAKLAGKLMHTNIVTVYDAEEEGEQSYIAMEYVNGKTLEEIIQKSIEYTPAQKLNIIIQICEGLNYAHKNGIVHRDIKPGNIIVTKDGHPKITDFGIAKAVASSTTVLGTILGTPGYMSPEQITGKAVDHRTDIFSLGTVFYEFLTGEKPFPGKTMTEILYRVVNENPVPPAIVNPGLQNGMNEVIMKALSKNPDDRFQNIGELEEVLKQIRSSRTVALSRTKLVFQTGEEIILRSFLGRYYSWFGNRIFSLISFLWAVTATIFCVALFFSRSEYESGLARSLSEERPASLLLKINVPDAAVTIDGNKIEMKESVLQIDSIGVGEHHIYISRDNYYPYETAVIFGKGESKYIDTKLKLLPVEIPPGGDTSYISITTTPPMARVETSYGKFLGYTPMDSMLFPAGKYTFLFLKDDHITKRKDVALNKNRLARAELSLEKQRGTVSLQNVFPGDASLFLDGRKIGKISRDNHYSMEVGEKTITIRAEGYDDLNKTVSVKADEMIELNDTLKAVYGSLMIRTNPSGADIYIDDREESAGKAPLLISDLLARVHKIRAVYRNEKRTQNTKVVKNDTAEAAIVFSSPNGFLDMNTDPPGADIYLNTVREGDLLTPVNKELKPGFYKVRLVHPKFKKFYEITVRVKAEQTTKINHKFE